MRLKHFNLQIGSQLMKAMGDETRLRILNLLLNNGAMTTSDLEFILDFTQTKTSRHIAYLKNAGILSAKKIDQWVLYSIKDEVTDIISQILSFVERDSQLVEDIETFKTLYSNRELAVNNITVKP
ncbi:MAG: transcriptional regulator [Bacteroidetes bacterium]|nr:MAG: transcriptional regulator [Bacteroidota bacterium]